MPLILRVMRVHEADDEVQKKALSMLWNLTISAAGISSVVAHQGVVVVLGIMQSHAASEEVQQNPG